MTRRLASAPAALAVPGDGGRRTFFLRHRATFIGGGRRGPPGAARELPREAPRPANGAAPRTAMSAPILRSATGGEWGSASTAAAATAAAATAATPTPPPPPSSAGCRRGEPSRAAARLRWPRCEGNDRRSPVANAATALDGGGGSSPAAGVGRAARRLHSGDEQPVSARRGAVRRGAREVGAAGRPGAAGRG